MFKKIFTAIIALLLAGTAVTANKGTITLAYAEWSSEIASSNVVRVILEKAGYKVNMTSLAAAVMYQAVADGQADGMVSAWLPSTQKEYYEKLKDEFVDLGPNLEGTKLGLIVPAYTYEAGVQSIADLETYADKFQNQIVGIDPGAGITKRTEDVIRRYDLKQMRLQRSSGAIMAASLAEAIKHHENIVVTGWTPHWMFERFDLKYLKDPRNVYGDSEEIVTIVRKGLKKEMPEVYTILDNFHWTPKDMNEVMLMNQEKGSTPYQNAKKWVAAHPERVKQWMQ